jgi:nucleoside-diphosphate-sugar epimerase
MNYLISGQSGFCGQAITKYLVERGNTVYGIPRSLTKEALIKYYRDFPPDYIIHLATYGNHYNSQRDFQQMLDTNVIGTFNLLEAAKSTQYRLFINFSATIQSDPLFYSTKYCAETLVKQYEKTITVRPYSVYGPGEASHKFIPKVISCLNSGEQLVIDEDAVHDWLYIDDLVNAVFAGETELGSGIKTTNKEIIILLEEISGKKLNYTKGKFHTYDNNNWETPKGVPHRSLYTGLKETYEYFTR